MEMAQLLAPNPTTTVHPEWIGHWGETIEDKKLKYDVFHNPRMLARIIDELSPSDDADTTADAAHKLAQRLAPFLNVESLHDVGLSWCSPRLFMCLFNPETRSACGNLSKPQVEIVKRFHMHTPAHSIPVLPHEEHVIDEGYACVTAWLMEQHTPAARLLQLRLHPRDMLKLRHIEARARVFDLFMNYSEEQAA